MANDVLEVVRGISQAAADSYDGAYDEKGEPITIGLKREVDNSVYVSRENQMDGFKVKINGDKLYINYQAEAPMHHVHRKGPAKYEGEVEETIDNIQKHLKKKFKKITGKTLKLKDEGEADILLQYMNRKRSWIQATKVYTIQNISKDVSEPEKEPFDKIVDFMKATRNYE
tara:strand:+ start:946 stop:1458 length:513 start_codon:yes stop_codon:yes gene_type:complete